MKSLPPTPKKSLKVAVVQMTSVDDVHANVQSVMHILSELRGKSCDLVCLPENALFLRINKKSDLAVGALNLKEDFWRDFQKFSKAQKCALIFGSVSVRRGKKCVNATVVVLPGQAPKVVYEKIHLFDVDVKGAPPVRESDYYVAGRKPQILKFKGWNIGLSICYDMRFSELYAKYAKKNAHLLLVPAAFLVPTGRAHWHVLLRARAIESQAFVVSAAQSGGHKNKQGDTRETYGHSLIVNPWGEVLSDLGEDGAAMTILTLQPEDLQNMRRQIPMVHHRRL
ncbi:MAG: carbon-nitrogen hydrolase family protein [Bdellovibrionales bacterium]|nr:carbon-nitrogen hydrolase family protein [Bdellovibrionales bacterium]